MKKIIVVIQIFISFILFAEDNIKIWDIKNNNAILKTEIGDNDAKVSCWNKDNMIININDEKLDLYNFKSLKIVKTIEIGEWVSKDYIISNNSSQIYAGIDSIYQIDINSMKASKVYDKEEIHEYLLKYNEKEDKLASTGYDGIIRIIDIKTRKKVKSIENPDASITDMCFSSDGKQLITSDRNGYIYMRDTNTLKVVKKFFHNSERSNALSVAISPDGKYIASGGTIDKIIKLWDVKTGKLLKELKGHTSVIYSLQFSTDSTKLLSASGKCDELNITDDKIKLWDISSGKVIMEIKGNKESAYRAIFTPDGNNIITWDGEQRAIEDFGD